jgi:mono/diheme cytochrome c family protein
MKPHSLCVALVLLAGSASIGLAQSDKHTPRLSEIMGMAQTQHLKLWLAAKAQNWDLVAYEAQQLKTSLADAALLYDNLPVSNVTTLLPPLQSILDAASAKNARNFADGMRELTDGCNACHRSLGRGFIMVQVPTDRQTNFGNQRFAPNGKQ